VIAPPPLTSATPFTVTWLSLPAGTIVLFIRPT
jgi:hypothetical protein